MTTPSPTVAGKSFRPSGRLLAFGIGVAALTAEVLLILGPARHKAPSETELPSETGVSTVLPARLLPATTITATDGDTNAHRRTSRSIQLVREDSDPANRIRVPRRTPRPSAPGIW